MATVIVVDDEYDLQQAVKGVLEDEGYDVLTCATGEEALAVVIQHRPDLLLLDLMLPAMSGYEVLDSLRSRPDMGDLPVVVMSAVRSPDDVVEQKAQCFLSKPFSVERLLEVVENYAHR